MTRNQDEPVLLGGKRGSVNFWRWYWRLTYTDSYWRDSNDGVWRRSVYGVRQGENHTTAFTPGTRCLVAFDGCILRRSGETAVTRTRITLRRSCPKGALWYKLL